MKNIIVPTDFSDTAKDAFLYAQELALYLDANIKVVNVHLPYYDAQNPRYSEDLRKDKEQLSTAMSRFIGGESSSYFDEIIATEMVATEVVLGLATEELIKLSMSNDVDLIVMGTTGKGDILTSVLGSVSSIVAQKAHCPVLLIPKGSKFKDYQEILYASNYQSANKILLKRISHFASLFPSNIHLVHINEFKNTGDVEFQEFILESLFRKNAPELDLKIMTAHSENVWTGLNTYAKENLIDLIIVATPHRDFWDNLTHKSVTKQMIMNAQSPIMILPINK